MKTLIHTLTTVILLVAVIILAGLLVNKKAEAPIKDAPQGSVIIPLSLVTINENASTSPTLDIEYPQFTGLSASFNDSISHAVLDKLAEFKKNVTENDEARKATSKDFPDSAIPMSSYSFISSWQPAQINGKYISFTMRFDSFTGGANENQQIETFNFDILKQKTLTLEDLFGSMPNYLETISNIARTQLRDSLSKAADGYSGEEMLKEGTAPTIDNFKNFTFDEYSVTFYFPKYQVAPGAFGEQKVSIPLHALK